MKSFFEEKRFALKFVEQPPSPQGEKRNRCLSVKIVDRTDKPEPPPSNLLKYSVSGGFWIFLFFYVKNKFRRPDTSGHADLIKEFERSGCQTNTSLNLAEKFRLRGNTAMHSKLYSDAIELYSYAFTLCESDSVYYRNRAVAFYNISKYEEAIRDCSKSIEINPNCSRAYKFLGFIYYEQGNYRDAIDKGFMKALQLDPDNTSLQEYIQDAERELRKFHRVQQNQNGRINK